MLTKKIAMATAAVASAGAIVGGGAAISNASTQIAGGTGSGYAQQAQQAQQAQCGDGMGGGMRHEHTEVTGAEATKVTDAVTAKDSGVTVESVRKDPGGSYDVMGTKDGQRVMVEVSADLATIEVRTGGPGRQGGPGGHGRHGGQDGRDGREQAGQDEGGTQAPTQAPAASPSTLA